LELLKCGLRKDQAEEIIVRVPYLASLIKESKFRQFEKSMAPVSDYARYSSKHFLITNPNVIFIDKKETSDIAVAQKSLELMNTMGVPIEDVPYHL
jgi:hypothetical protein